VPQATPFISGRIVGLHTLEPSDTDRLLGWVNQEELRACLKITFPFTEAMERAWLEQPRTDPPVNLIFGIVVRDAARHIGTIGLHKIDFLHGTAVTGTIVGSPEDRGKGYGYHAKMLLLDYAFNTLGLRKINSSVYDFNAASQRCLEKCGYVKEGLLKAQFFKNGRYIDVVQVAVFREAWLELWAKVRDEIKG
jgi:RimJ/RimL family protein N-acetyltransferase